MLDTAAEQAGEARLMKQWLTAEGAPHPRHADYSDLDGQTRGLNGAFDVRGFALMYPGDPNGPPGEVCQCRCALAFVEAGSGDG
jgi:hypothetical protein